MELNGKYRAIVVDNKDDKKARRVRVEIPTFGKHAQTHWCHPSSMLKHDFVPEVGETVWLEFEMGDPQFPVYSGDFTTIPDVSQEMKDAYDSDIDNIHKYQLIKDYNGHKIYKSPDGLLVTDSAGQTVEMNTISGSEKIEVKDKAGNTVLMNKDGMILTDKQATPNVVTMSSGGVVIDCTNGNKIDMKSSSITMNGNFEVLQ